MEKLLKSIRNTLQEHEGLNEANTCRTTTLALADHVRQNFPNARIEYLVFPEARAGVGVHYALLITYLDQKILVNSVKAALFPRYIGVYDNAPPTFNLMKFTSEII